MHQRPDVKSSVLQSVARQYRRCSSGRSVVYNAAVSGGLGANVLLHDRLCLRAWYLSFIFHWKIGAFAFVICKLFAKG